MAYKIEKKHYVIGGIILALILIYIFRDQLMNLWNSMTGQAKRMYAVGGELGGGFNPPTPPITPVAPVNPPNGGHHPHPTPVFRQVYPVYYPVCPDWTGRPVKNVSFYGASNLFFPNIGGVVYGNCPTCITYNGVTYYFNGSDANGCYYQANYNYIYPTFFPFFSRFHGRGHHGGPGGPGSGTGPGGPGGHGSGTGGGGTGGPGSGTGNH